MKKNNRTMVALGTATIALALGAYGTVAAGSTTAATDRTTATVAVIDQQEIDTLLHMTEEEKLAHDVYVTLGDTWDVDVFDRISSSEATHLAAMQQLLDTYGIADPTVGNGLGEFTDPAFDELYDELVARGSSSVVEALKVGAFIEETDILDLRAAIDDTTDADIVTVYTRLLAGSERHLRAFDRQLALRGVAYEPVLLSDAEYAAILDGTTGRGGSGGAVGAGRSGTANGPRNGSTNTQQAQRNRCC